MVSEVTLRYATEADTDAILGLVKLSLGEGRIPRTAAFWSWKHRNSPFGPSPTLVAQADGNLVGLRVFMRWQWVAAGKFVQAVRAVDTATHPAWRGKGIFSRLTLALVEKMRAEGVSFVFNTPNRLSRPGYLKMGWSDVGRTSLWIRPLHPIDLARRYLFNGSTRPVDESWPAAGRWQRVDELLQQPELPDLLSQLADGDARLRTPRTVEYLRWRYRDVPDIHYFTVYRFGGREGAAVIFRAKGQGALRELRICEVLVSPGRESLSTGRALLRELASQADADYVAAMAAPRTPEQRVLLRVGFLPALRLGPILTVRPLAAPGTEVPFHHSAWRASVGDLELF